MGGGSLQEPLYSTPRHMCRPLPKTDPQAGMCTPSTDGGRGTGAVAHAHAPALVCTVSWYPPTWVLH